MCFSATASYVASAALLLCGIGSMYRANKNQRLFAAMPLLFALQQFIEGTIWFSLSNGNPAIFNTYAYLSFVYILWPNWIPYSIFPLCKTAAEKKALGPSMIAGLLLSILAIGYLFFYPPTAIIENHHIKYLSDVPKWLWLPGSALYLAATVVPFFIPKVRNLSLMGILLALSYIATIIFYYATILSVWCFFAAILSALIFVII